MVMTGIGMVALLGTFGSFVVALACCLLAAFLIGQRLKDAPAAMPVPGD